MGPVTEIVRANDTALANAPLTPADVVGQVALVQQVMEAVMHKDEHYGVIPGCGDKPTLLQPGAQKLAFTFRLAPSFSIDERNLDGGHREIVVTCRLASINTGQFVGEGVGSCSTMESKYRWRTGPVDFTGQPVPGAYWEQRKSDPKAAQKLLGGPGHSVKKNPETGAWEIVTQGERVENPDIADTYNTVLKMAKKRAFVDAVLTATAASDIFTQDIEDLTVPHAAPVAHTAPVQAAPAPAPAPAAPSQRQTPTVDEVIEEAGWEVVDEIPHGGEPSVQLTFGKYKGMFLSDVVDTDADYVNWLANNAREQSVRDEANRLLGSKPAAAPADEFGDEIPF